MVEKIKELCKRERIPISRMQRELGLNPNDIYRWKEHKPSVDKVKAVADYLHVTVDYLLEGDK